ncbi:MAG TPA: hypothetical protein VNP73_01880 [Actinomycetota bacterium]|nr:hypothetical protein [Actinomycetota bacterium]
MRSKALACASALLLLAAPTFALAQEHDHHAGGECHPTPEQKHEAAEFARRTMAAAKPYEDPAYAFENDFIPWVDAWKPVFHFVKYEHYYDWKVLDPNRPEAFVYAKTNTGLQLIGVMFSMEDPGRKPPDFGGCITRWHTHPQCVAPIGYSHIWEEDWGGCPPGWEEDNGGSELMLHVWTVPMEGGPYAYHPDSSWECWPQPAPC